VLNTYKNRFDLDDYKKIVGIKTNIHKVSYFFKDDILDLHDKKILIFDLEFSKNKVIFEIGGLVLNNSKVEKTFFKEFKLPYGEPYWCFERNSFITAPLNTTKKEFSSKDTAWLMNLIDSVDYVMVHNYVAESQCLAKLNNKVYSSNTCELVQNKKFICTNYSFKNKYFKSQGLTDTSNGAVSDFFGWEIESEENKYIIKNDGVKFYIEKPIGVKSVLHNSFYDSVVTLTNFMSLKKIGS